MCRENEAGVSRRECLMPWWLFVLFFVSAVPDDAHADPNVGSLQRCDGCVRIFGSDEVENKSLSLVWESLLSKRRVAENCKEKGGLRYGDACSIVFGPELQEDVPESLERGLLLPPRRIVETSDMSTATLLLLDSIWWEEKDIESCRGSGRNCYWQEMAPNTVVEIGDAEAEGQGVNILLGFGRLIFGGLGSGPAPTFESEVVRVYPQERSLFGFEHANSVSIVAVYEGAVLVEAGGSVIEVRAGFRVLVEMDETPMLFLMEMDQYHPSRLTSEIQLEDPLTLDLLEVSTFGRF